MVGSLGCFAELVLNLTPVSFAVPTTLTSGSIKKAVSLSAPPRTWDRGCSGAGECHGK